MVRGGTMYARAARRAAMQARALNEANGSQPSNVSRTTCRYCGSEFESQTSRDRHISLSICSVKHEYWVGGKAGQKRRHEYEEDSPETLDVMDCPPPAKQTCIDETVSAVAGPSQHPDAVHDPNHPPTPAPDLDPSIDLDDKKPRGFTRDGVFVEPFPISSAGAPIGTRSVNEEDLRAYLESCGSLGIPNSSIPLK
ncbi:hypothetical protein FRC12_011906 [Ceratobasidium sp. 428]|nr:hypothetical protein FRC12_011906 [Ceratobasidium sp. 428]